MQTSPLLPFAMFSAVALTTPSLPAQRLPAGPGDPGRTRAPEARVVAFDAQRTGRGTLFHIEADVPKHHLVSVETRVAGGGWQPAEDEVLSPDGAAEFHVWSEQPGALFRVKTRPFPDLALSPEGSFRFDGAIRDDVLSLYLRGGMGMRVGVPSGVGEAPIWHDGVAPLTGGGAFGVLSGDTGASGGIGVLENLKELYQRPGLFLIAPGADKQTSASAIYGESLKVPVAWVRANKAAKRARYVIQRTPFSDPSAYTPPTNHSVVGWIDNPWSADQGAQVSFWMDFAKQGIYGIEPPEPFFVRLYEEDDDGNIVGWPSNTFTFVVREPETQWPLPAGELQFKLKRIKCYDTTSGPGKDEIHWVVLRFQFSDDKVSVAEVSSGMRSFGDGDAHWPQHLLAKWNGPANLPAVADTWYVFCMREYDSHVDPVATFYQHKLQQMAFLATGAWQAGWSQAQVVNYVRDHHDSFGWWFSHIGCDKIGHWAFRLNSSMLSQAVANGQKRKSIAMGGSGSSYGAWFDLDFYPY